MTPAQLRRARRLEGLYFAWMDAKSAHRVHCTDRTQAALDAAIDAYFNAANPPRKRKSA